MIYSDENAEFNLGAHQEGQQLLIAVKLGYKHWEEVVEIKKGVDIEMNIDREPEVDPTEPPVDPVEPDEPPAT